MYGEKKGLPIDNASMEMYKFMIKTCRGQIKARALKLLISNCPRILVTTGLDNC